MNDLMVYIRDICIAAAGCALIGFIIPKGNIRKTASSLLGIFVVQAVMLPFLNKLKDSEFDLYSFEPSESYISSDISVEAVKTEAEGIIKDILEANDIDCVSVSVECNITENGVINIEGATIYVTSPVGGDIESIVKEKTGVTAVVVLQGGG